VKRLCHAKQNQYLLVSRSFWMWNSSLKWVLLSLKANFPFAAEKREFPKLIWSEVCGNRWWSVFEQWAFVPFFLLSLLVNHLSGPFQESSACSTLLVHPRRSQNQSWEDFEASLSFSLGLHVCVCEHACMCVCVHVGVCECTCACVFPFLFHLFVFAT